MDREQYQFFSDLGRVLTPDLFARTAARFAGRAPRPDPATCRVTRDIPYGHHPRHRLDVFAPPGRSGCPVLVYVHGGGFVRGDKGGPADPWYNNLGAWAVARGCVAVTLNYRLAPSSPWPAGPQDIADALDWVAAQIGSHGGDPARIVLMGQSAGAVHVAGYVARQHGRTDARPLAGAVMLSGLYDLATLAFSDYERAYFGTAPGQFAAQSTLPALVQSDLPMLFSVAEFDPETFQQQAAQLVAARMRARGAWPRILYLGGQNHVSALYQLGLSPDPLGPALADFIDFATGR